MRRAVKALLLLGSNVGARERHLSRALAGFKVLKRSALYETAPIGPSSRPYLNQVVEIETAFSPVGLLVDCKRREALAGRRPAAKWSARALDLDILKYGRFRVRTRILRVPHPLILRRPFVLAPLSEVAPSWRPDGRVTVSRRLRQLRPDPRIVRMVE